MTKILAIDTSSDACSAALSTEHGTNELFIVEAKQHTNYLLPMVDELLAKAQLTLSELDAIAFGSGPGSFTGIRLAASVTQGLSFAHDIPVIRVSTLQALAQEAFSELNIPKVQIAQDARMQAVYYGEYQIDNNGIMQAITQDKLIKPEDIVDTLDEKTLCMGSGFEAYKDIFAKKPLKFIEKSHVHAKYVAQLALIMLENGTKESSENALPTYLREKVATPQS